MSQRYFSNTATPNALSGAINNTDVITTAPLQSALSGWPSSTPFIAVIDGGSAAEEVVLVTAVSGVSVTFTRGYDGTTKVSHANLAPFTHDAAAIDYREANSHVNATQQVHGLGAGSSLVGTTDVQTLSNKTLTTPTVADLTGMQHDHTTASKGGNVPQSAITGLTASLAAKEDASAHATDIGTVNASITTLSGTVTTNDGLAVHKAGTETITGAKTFSGGASVAGLTASGASNVPTTPGRTGVKKFYTSTTVTFSSQTGASAALNWSGGGFTTVIHINLTIVAGASIPVAARMDSGYSATAGNAFVFSDSAASGTFTVLAEVIGT